MLSARGEELLAVLSIDGERFVVRRGRRRKACICWRKQWHTGRVVVAQAGAMKTNEHKENAHFLSEILLKETVVVGDAAFCQRVCANRFSPPKCVLAVKNQSTHVKSRNPAGIQDADGHLGPV